MAGRVPGVGGDLPALWQNCRTFYGLRRYDFGTEQIGYLRWWDFFYRLKHRYMIERTSFVHSWNDDVLANVARFSSLLLADFFFFLLAAWKYLPCKVWSATLLCSCMHTHMHTRMVCTCTHQTPLYTHTCMHTNYAHTHTHTHIFMQTMYTHMQFANTHKMPTHTPHTPSHTHTHTASCTPKWRLISRIQNCDHVMKTLYTLRNVHEQQLHKVHFACLRLRLWGAKLISILLFTTHIPQPYTHTHTHTHTPHIHTRYVNCGQ